MDGFDCISTQNLDVAAAKAAGVKWISRYLCPAGQPGWRAAKRLTLPERRRLEAFGFKVITNFQDGKDHAGRGAGQGAIDGRVALTNLTECEYPPGSTLIPVSTDYDARASEEPAVLAYYRAFAQTCPGYELDAYGSSAIIGMLQRAKAIIPDGGWLTQSTGFRKDPTAHIAVRQGPTTRAFGLEIDPNTGFFPAPAISPPPPPPLEDWQSQVLTEGWLPMAGVFQSEADARQAAVVSWFGLYLRREPRVDEMVYWANFIINGGFAAALLWFLRDNGVFTGARAVDKLPGGDEELTAQQAEEQSTKIAETRP